MTERLEALYPAELDFLSRLFGAVLLEKSLPRLNEIYEHAETNWVEYVELLSNRPVRFLLIAEAPPWTASGRPRYALDAESAPRTLMKALWTTFQLTVGERSSPYIALAKLAGEGFLLVDSTPFAMDYSSKRSSPHYHSLIRMTSRNYLQARLRTSSLTWSDDVRVAFAVKRNALSIIGATPSLDLGSAKCVLSEEMIAVNGAGYPDGRKMASLYGRFS